MRRALPFALLLSTALPAWAELAPPEGHVILTMGGAVDETNLPARGEDDGGLLGFLEITHDGAAGFDAFMLDGLEQIEITIPYGPPDNQRIYTFSGPLLSDVMALAGAAGKTALPMAMDGYQAEIRWQSIETHQPIVATRADGIPMGIGGYGPTMIVFPPTDDSELAQEQASQQVWAIAYIAIE
ncbi:hypothetical protein SAMN05444358_101483 [Ruegeria halocynthiae]|uniref:Oxidoreductase molybdopterin binding domain-containing protein n=1 Tax=Ruegeria halocynthiae TaxID=985054 RepID=A0A1H2SIZ6_9RHOB|nr:hypothetical protein [Ruegeria halocynthiae]SDW31560.1 hypothetical protein SAMN05444358_101483 [Ruegeria halocynthiae]